VPLSRWLRHINVNKSVQTKLNSNNNKEFTKEERSLRILYLIRKTSIIIFKWNIISEKSIIKNIFDQIRRKSPKAIDIKSSNTDIKSYGELSPGPGHYNPYENNVNHNLRYKNLILIQIRK
jgi:hypothetical protein